jgi:hypothetical protein
VGRSESLWTSKSLAELLGALPTMVSRDDAGHERESPFLFTTTGRSPISEARSASGDISPIKRLSFLLSCKNAAWRRA